MKTYAESKGKKPFDWNEALQKCLSGEIKDGSFEHSKMTLLSYDWITCACGNQCDIIPRNEFGVPEDMSLHLLGDSFMDYVEFFQIELAIETLQQIEKRSAELIKNIQNGNVL